MSASLAKVDGQIAMMYAADGGVPWHKNGTPTDTAVTSEEALRLAHMADWDLQFRKIRLVDGKQIPTHMAVFRGLDERVMGITSPTYKLMTNEDNVAWLDSLYADGQLLYDTAGVIDTNRSLTCWMLARMTEDMRIRDDIIAKYLLGSWSHDGNHSLRVHATETRVVCANTYNAAVSDKNDQLVRITHSGNTVMKLELARQQLQIVDDRHRRMEQWMLSMAEYDVETPFEISIQTALFGEIDDATPTQRKNSAEMFSKIYTEEAARNGRTAYSLFNAVTGFGDYGVRITARGSQMASMLGGQGAAFKKKGVVALQKMTGITI